MIHKVKRQPKHIVIDLETTSLDRHKGDIFAYCLCDTIGNVNILRKGRDKNYETILKDYLWSISETKIAHNYKFEYGFLLQKGYNIHPQAQWHDTMLMHQILHNLHPRHGLDFLIEDYFDYEINYDGEIYNAKDIDKKVMVQAKERGTKEHPRFDMVDKDLMQVYQYSDGQRGMLLFQLLFPEIQKDRKVYEDYLNEIALVKTTIGMENHGINVDVSECKRLIEWLKKQHEETQALTYDLLGEFANLNSDKQLQEILFKRFDYSPIAYTEKGSPKTDKDVLMTLKQCYPDNKIFDLILCWRSYTNGITTIEKYLDLMNDKHLIFPNIKTNEAKTGRESSENPNMQNVPKETGLKTLYPVPARRCFRAMPDSSILFVDYAGIEMRLIINKVHEPEMMDILKRDENIHVPACEIFYQKDEFNNVYIKRGIDLPVFISKKESKTLYSSGKNGHFALPYGAAPDKMASTLMLPLEVTRKRLNDYKNRFPLIYGFAKSVYREAKENGYIITPFNKKLEVPQEALFASANYLIQGTAAGLFKRAQVRVDHYLRTVWNNEIHLLLPIHDELLMHFPNYLAEYKDQVKSDIKKIMIDMPEIDVALDVEYKETFERWSDAK